MWMCLLACFIYRLKLRWLLVIQTCIWWHLLFYDLVVEYGDMTDFFPQFQSVLLTVRLPQAQGVCRLPLYSGSRLFCPMKICLTSGLKNSTSFYWMGPGKNWPFKAKKNSYFWPLQAGYTVLQYKGWKKTVIFIRLVHDQKRKGYHLSLRWKTSTQDWRLIWDFCC